METNFVHFYEDGAKQFATENLDFVDKQKLSAIELNKNTHKHSRVLNFSSRVLQCKKRRHKRKMNFMLQRFQEKCPICSN